jgi:hypothetical protein
MRAPNVQHRGYEGDRESSTILYIRALFKQDIFSEDKESKRYAASSSSSPAGFRFPAFPSRAWRLEKLAAFVPLPRVHLVRSGGCLAPHAARHPRSHSASAGRGWR